MNRRPPSYSPFPILRAIEKFTRTDLPAVITVVGLGIVFYSFFREVDWPRLDVHPRILIGPCVMLFGLVLKGVKNWQLDRHDSTPIAPTCDRGSYDDVKYADRIVDSKESAALLARFVEEVYPYSYVSRVEAIEREAVYRRWLEACPGFARLIVRNDPSGESEVIGFSIILRTDRETYARYRNGENDPWTWDKRNLMRADQHGTPFLFVQGIYCSRSESRHGPDLLHRVFFDHVASFCSNVLALPPVIYAPARQKQTRSNYQILGLEQARTSRGGFEIWELDCRRIQELSLSAFSSFESIQSCGSAGAPEVLAGADLRIRPLVAEDYHDVHRLWMREGILLRDSDDHAFFWKYVDRNPGLSFVAVSHDRIVGVVLCGHDGRAGYIHHLAVSSEARRKGIGRNLVERARMALQSHGVLRSNAFVLNENRTATEFWAATGWSRRGGLSIYGRGYESAKR